MVVKSLTAAVVAGLAFMGVAVGTATAATHPIPPKDGNFSFEGPFGSFDRAAMQRGFKVYAEVCAACHGMNLLSYRNLAQPGGPFYDERYPNPNDSPYAKAIAAAVEVNDIDSETGDLVPRPATPADRFRQPFANEAAARAVNGGAYPPDMSVITKARAGGPDYIYSLLTGYSAPPAGLTVPPGQYYNEFFPGDLTSAWTGDRKEVPHGGFLAMPQQLVPGRVTYDDGTEATVDQMAKDVTTFLAWAAEPVQEERKRTGWAVLIYLLIFAGLTYASYRRIWRNVAH
jgi:ubiquinol-cytochrome c reductase cytochrome c1 subunit